MGRWPIEGVADMPRRTLALVLASTGVAIEAVTMGRVWHALIASPADHPLAPLWPFPALYFIEVVALAMVVFLAVLIRGPYRRAPFAGWAALGALAVVSVLGAMTIGPL